MTYGHWLDRATAALQAARETAATTRAAGHGDAAATITARNLVYHRLVRLADQLGGSPRIEATIRTAEHMVNSDTRLTTTSPARILGLGLRTAIATTAPAPPDAAVGNELAAQLTTAADALGIAADILTSHLGSPHRPARTPEGYALATGVGRTGAWADLAKLAGDMVEVDRRLPTWLSRGRTPRTLRPVYQVAVDRLRWWTRSRYPTILNTIAGQASGESVLRLLETAQPTELSTAPRQINSPRDVEDVLDAARAWLHQHPGRVKYAHAVAATRLAVTISSAAARLDPPPPIDATAYAQRWGRVARTLQPLAGIEASGADTLVRELDSASDWLRHRIRSQPAVRVHPGAPLNPDWHTAQTRLLGKLPGLAAQLNCALATMVGRGHLCVAQFELDLSTSKRSVFYAKARWRKARPADDEVKLLRERLGEAGRAPANREQALRQALGDPVALVCSSYPQPPASAMATNASPAKSTSPGSVARRSRTSRRL